MSKYGINLGEIKCVEQTHSNISNNISIISGDGRRSSAIEIRGLELDDLDGKEASMSHEDSSHEVCAKVLGEILKDDRIVACSRLIGQIILPIHLYREIIAAAMKVPIESIVINMTQVQMELTVSCCRIVPANPIERFIYNINAVFYNNENIQFSQHAKFSKLFTENGIDSTKVLVLD